jgi:hypothetical protein
MRRDSHQKITAQGFRAGFSRRNNRNCIIHRTSGLSICQDYRIPLAFALRDRIDSVRRPVLAGVAYCMAIAPFLHPHGLRCHCRLARSSVTYESV